MADKQQRTTPEPRGFGERSRGLPGEYAHEQGWGLEEEERRRQVASPKDTDGGNEYNYGARDFGDEPENMARSGKSGGEEAARHALGMDPTKGRKEMASAQRKSEPLKKHGDVMESAIADVDRHAKGRIDPIPMPDRGGHEKSHAAHLGGDRHDHTKPESSLNHGAVGELREPPQEVSRIGKRHRKQ